MVSAKNNNKAQAKLRNAKKATEAKHAHTTVSADALNTPAEKEGVVNGTVPHMGGGSDGENVVENTSFPNSPEDAGDSSANKSKTIRVKRNDPYGTTQPALYTPTDPTKASSTPGETHLAGESLASGKGNSRNYTGTGRHEMYHTGRVVSRTIPPRHTMGTTNPSSDPMLDYAHHYRNPAFPPNWTPHMQHSTPNSMLPTDYEGHLRQELIDRVGPDLCRVLCEAYVEAKMNVPNAQQQQQNYLSSCSVPTCDEILYHEAYYLSRVLYLTAPPFAVAVYQALEESVRRSFPPHVVDDVLQYILSYYPTSIEQFRLLLHPNAISNLFKQFSSASMQSMTSANHDYFFPPTHTGGEMEYGNYVSPPLSSNKVPMRTRGAAPSPSNGSVASRTLPSANESGNITPEDAVNVDSTLPNAGCGWHESGASPADMFVAHPMGRGMGHWAHRHHHPRGHSSLQAPPGRIKESKRYGAARPGRANQLYSNNNNSNNNNNSINNMQNPANASGVENSKSLGMDSAYDMTPANFVTSIEEGTKDLELFLTSVNLMAIHPQLCEAHMWLPMLRSIPLGRIHDELTNCVSNRALRQRLIDALHSTIDPRATHKEKQGMWLQAREEGRTVYIRGLQDLTDYMIRSYLNYHHGEVVDMRYMFDPRSSTFLGYGFVMFQDSSAVDSILRRSTYHIGDGYSLQVKCSDMILRP